MTILQQNMLLALYERQYLPVACFSLAKEGDDDLYSVALAPVYLGSAGDTMEQVKALGAELTQLEEGGLISLDYDMPLSGYAYTEYELSDLYAYFKETVRESQKLPGALFDTPTLELGSMALTDAGRLAVEKMMQ